MRTPSPALTRPSGATLAAPVRKTVRQQSQTARAALIGDHTSQRTPDRLPGNRADRATAAQTGDILAFSIPEFCRRHGISRAHFYNLSKNGGAPAVMRVGRRTLISTEAAARWRMRMEELARSASAR
jgi:hypothetical protein